MIHMTESSFTLDGKRYARCRCGWMSEPEDGLTLNQVHKIGDAHLAEANAQRASRTAEGI